MRFILIISFLLSLSQLLAQSNPGYDHIPDAAYDQIADRISCIEAEVPLNFNEKVKNFVEYFTVRDRPYMRGVMERVELYFPIFEEALAKYNLPDELKYLSVVESGLRPIAHSRASAVGLWQFMSATGRVYGLKNDWYLDDRMDPHASTDAAVRHLRDLYRVFDDWELALAAYNCGSGNVRKAIRRSGYKDNFWEIYDYLPRETRSYVPQFVAIAYTMNYATEHNLYPDKIDRLPESDTILISQYFHLETFAAQLDFCLEDLLRLNPAIKRGAVPDGTKNYILRVPQDLKAKIINERTLLYDTAGRVGKEQLDFLARNTPGSTYGRDRLTYRVRSGDVLGTIANTYGVRVSDIKSWNKLKGNMIRVGQNLKIYVLPNYSSATKDLYASNSTTQTVPSLLGKKTHYVRSGDSLWEIAKAYDGLSIEKLKELNNLSSNTIKAGQRLIISSK